MIKITLRDFHFLFQDIKYDSTHPTREFLSLCILKRVVANNLLNVTTDVIMPSTQNYLEASGGDVFMRPWCTSFLALTLAFHFWRLHLRFKNHTVVFTSEDYLAEQNVEVS